MIRREALPTRVREWSLALLPALVLLAVVIVWAATGGGYESLPVLGGYEPNPWYLGALILIGLCCATGFGLSRVRLSLWTGVACAALAAYTAWSFLSILWAHDQGAALLGSDRALVYFAAFTTFAIVPWTSWSLRFALGALVVGLGALAIVTAIRLSVLANPSALYLDARLVYPLGYYNADAAMFTMTALVAIALCSRRETWIPMRVAGLVIAAVCLQLAVLGQSRGWLFTLPVVFAFALLIVPGRLRLLTFALGPVLATALVAPLLLSVYRKATVAGVGLTQPRLGHVLHTQGAQAARVMLIADAALALFGTVAVMLDRRVNVGPAPTRRLNRSVAALATVAIVAGIAGGLLFTGGHPVARLERAWNSFANASSTGSGGASRFTALGSQRADFWRVALHEWSSHPLLGIGQDNFAAAYLRARHTEQEPRWAHSLELRLLVHTGLVGALLFALFLIGLALAALRPTGTPLRSERVAVGIALLPLVVWLVHGSIDWFWEFPALSVPALAFAGAAAALGSASRSASFSLRAPRGETRVRTNSVGPPAKRGSVPQGALAWVGAALLGVAALAAVAIPFAAAHEVQKAIALWPNRPALAYAELRSASSLLPFDAQIPLVGGAIALDLGEAQKARGLFKQAQKSDGEGWLAPFVIGLLDSEQGRPAAARGQLEVARSLNPLETLIPQALARLHSRYPLTVAEAQSDLSLRSQARFGH